MDNFQLGVAIFASTYSQCGRYGLNVVHTSSDWKAEKPPTLGNRPKKRSRQGCDKKPVSSTSGHSSSLHSSPHKDQFTVMDQDNQVESTGALLVLDPDTERFFKVETRIQDTEELRKHIIQVQQEACKAGRYFLANGVLHMEAALNTVFVCSGLPLSLYSWVQVREAQDC